MKVDVLPDSRLKDSSLATVMMDWSMPDWTTVRIEAVPFYCANCGKHQGYCPKENTQWMFYLCTQCFETCGTIAGTLAVPDQEFWDKVQGEMLDRFGHILDERELLVLAEEGWGTLASLAKESPIKT